MEICREGEGGGECLDLRLGVILEFTRGYGIAGFFTEILIEMF